MPHTDKVNAESNETVDCESNTLARNSTVQGHVDCHGKGCSQCRNGFVNAAFVSENGK